MSGANFEKLLLAYSQSSSEEHASAIEDDIWKHFGQELAIVVIDMAGFSSLCLRYGIIHYLALIRELQQEVKFALERHKGRLLKFEADNAFASFELPQDAVSFLLELNAIFRERNAEREERYRIFLASGIDYGQVLIPEPGEFFGNTVNRASKLGEDLARAGEILISDEAYAHLDETLRPAVEPIDFQISGISLNAWRVSQET